MSFKSLVIKITGIFLKLDCEKKNITKNYTLFENVEFVDSTIGDFSYIARNSIVHNCQIGKFCSLGPNVVIGYGDHPTNHLSTSPVFYSQNLNFSIRVKENYYYGHSKVNIGNDVWIGAGVFIKNGVTVGDGAIIGAHAVVLKDVEPFSINVGAPSRLTSYRFDEDTVSALMNLQWWLLPDELIKENIDLFTTGNNLNSRIGKIENLKASIVK